MRRAEVEAPVRGTPAVAVLLLAAAVGVPAAIASEPPNGKLEAPMLLSVEVVPDPAPSGRATSEPCEKTGPSRCDSARAGAAPAPGGEPAAAASGTEPIAPTIR